MRRSREGVEDNSLEPVKTILPAQTSLAHKEVICLSVSRIQSSDVFPCCPFQIGDDQPENPTNTQELSGVFKSSMKFAQSQVFQNVTGIGSATTCIPDRQAPDNISRFDVGWKAPHIFRGQFPDDESPLPFQCKRG